MLESNLLPGNQKIPADLKDLCYGVSITDACVGWDDTASMIEHAAALLRRAELNGGKMEVL